MDDFQPVGVVAAEVLELSPNQPPKVSVLVVVAHTVDGPSLHAVYNLSVVDVHGYVADEEGQGHVESEDLAGGAVEVIVGHPALVGDLDTVGWIYTTDHPPAQ